MLHYETSDGFCPACAFMAHVDPEISEAIDGIMGPIMLVEAGEPMTYPAIPSGHARRAFAEWSEHSRSTGAFVLFETLTDHPVKTGQVPGREYDWIEVRLDIPIERAEARRLLAKLVQR